MTLVHQVLAFWRYIDKIPSDLLDLVDGLHFTHFASRADDLETTFNCKEQFSPYLHQVKCSIWVEDTTSQGED